MGVMTGGTDWMSDGAERKKDCFMMLMLIINIIVLRMRNYMFLLLKMIMTRRRNVKNCHTLNECEFKAFSTN